MYEHEQIQKNNSFPQYICTKLLHPAIDNETFEDIPSLCRFVKFFLFYF